MKRPTELDMLTRLRTDHGYMFAELRHKADRITTTFRRTKNGSFKTEMAVCIRLIVPETSVLGKDIIANRKKAEAKKARSVAAKNSGGWIRKRPAKKARALASKSVTAVGSVKARAAASKPRPDIGGGYTTAKRGSR